MRVSEFDGMYDVVLLPTFAQVEHWRKRGAEVRAAGLFSQTVTTFNAWIADLWELHGDGRTIVDSLQRRVAMQAAFEQMQIEDLVASPGVVKLAAQCARVASGLPVFERALDVATDGSCPEGLSLREAQLLAGISRYRELLEEAGFVELGMAASILACDSSRVFARPLRVLVAEASPLDWIASEFFDACTQLQADVHLAPGTDGVERAPEQVDLRFAFPSGRYAQPALVVDLVREAYAASCEGKAGEANGANENGANAGEASAGVGEWSAAVTCKDPLGVYKQVENVLADAGIVGCVQAQVRFSATDFGKQFLLLAQALLDSESGRVSDLTQLKDSVSDAAAPPFSGISFNDAIEADKQMRANRLAQLDEVLAALRMSSDTFSHLEELASDPEADILLGVFEQIAFSTPGRSAAWRAEQLTAAAALRSCTGVARLVGASMKSCMHVLEDTVVTVSYEADLDEGRDAGAGASDGSSASAGNDVSALPGGSGAGADVSASADGAGSAHAVRPRVTFTTQSAAARMGEGACDLLVLCDLTSEDYPVADKDDAAATLFAKLGLAPVDNALARARRQFAALQRLPRVQLVCMRPLNDVNGAPTYPAAILQEFVDAYRKDATSEDDLDEVYGLPEAFRVTLSQRGEELLYANAASDGVGTSQPIACEAAHRDLGDVSGELSRLVALPRRGADGRAIPGFSPSPSQIEAYLECPYKWFAQSRVGVDELDEGFGALERGSYCHAVLQEFYQRFQAMGHRKVDSSNLEQARCLMSDVADEVAAAQALLEPGSGRYVAISQMELRELETCKDQLVAYLDFEEQLLPDFHPAYLEYSFKPEDGARYADRLFVGTVDRIDVDDAGNAVIIDYKGSLTDAHGIAGKSDENPGKVQTRMYAQVVGRELGLNVVGALYVSYGKSHACSGAFDARALEAPHLPDMRHKNCSCIDAGPVDVGSDVVEIDEEGHSNRPDSLNQPLDYSELSFSDMLDRTEQLVSRAADAMEAGIVAPDPVNADACKYCPVEQCPKRGA